MLRASTGHVIAYESQAFLSYAWVCPVAPGRSADPQKTLAFRSSDVLMYRFTSGPDPSLISVISGKVLVFRSPDVPITRFLRFLNPVELRLQKSRIYSASL
jgi:hypothetical protein